MRNYFLRKTILGTGIILILIAARVNPGFAIDADIWGLPIPEGSQIVWKDKIMEINGIRAPSTRFLAEMGTDKILEFYKGIFLKDKWEQLGELAGIDMAGFTKEGRYVYIAVFDSAQNSKKDVYLVKSLCSLGLCYTLRDTVFQDKLVEDMPGRDLPGILRYPGSKRRMSFLIPIEGDFLLYEAEARPQDIAEFYRKVLKDNGWQEDAYLTEDVEKALPKEYKDKFAVVSFYKGKDSLIINITSAFETDKSKQSLARRSMIMISRNPGKMMVSAGGQK